MNGSISDSKTRADELLSWVLSAVEHEVRNDLAEIRRIVPELLRSEDPKIQAAGRKLDARLMERVRAAMATIVTLAATEYPERLVVETIRVSDLVEEIRSYAAPLVARKGLQFACSHTGPREQVVCGHDVVWLAVRILIDNAIKFTNAGAIMLAFASESDAFTLAVTDTGRGISREFLPRVFELGTREDHADGRAPGFGLGLWLVKRAALIHGGVAHAASEGIQKGATVSITLPQ